MVYTCKESYSEEMRTMDPNELIEGLEVITANPWIIAVAVALLLTVFFAIFKTSIKIAFKLLLNAIIGFVLLFVFNALGSIIGVTLAVNWVNAIIAGILGIPGIALLLILRWMGIM